MSACRPFGAVSEVAAARHGAVTRRQAADRGLTKTVIARLIRDGVLAEPVPGVLVARAAPNTWRQQLYVATLASRGAGAAGFRAAAALHAMDGYQPGPVELLVPTSRHIELPRLVMHRGPVPRTDVLPVDGIRCTSIARTLCDVASVDERDRVRLAFEWAWRTGVSLTWLRQTAQRLASPRRRGPAAILALVADAERRRRPTDSALEVEVEAVIGSLPGIVRQFVVEREDHTRIGRVDFAIPSLRIAIEAHSRQHHWGPEASDHDARREADMHAAGWIVRFVTDHQRRHPEELRRTLWGLVAARSRVFGSIPA